MVSDLDGLQKKYDQKRKPGTSSISPPVGEPAAKKQPPAVIEEDFPDLKLSNGSSPKLRGKSVNASLSA